MDLSTVNIPRAWYTPVNFATGTSAGSTNRRDQTDCSPFSLSLSLSLPPSRSLLASFYLSLSLFSSLPLPPPLGAKFSGHLLCPEEKAPPERVASQWPPNASQTVLKLTLLVCATNPSTLERE